MEEKVLLSDVEKERFIKWIVRNVDERIIPADEGNGQALIYNLVHLIRGDGKEYNYRASEDEELRTLGIEM